MSSTLAAFLISFGTVTLAEMGDKTQLLAMAFAARIKPAKVLAGVFAATILNHALAVAAGSLLAHYTAIALWVKALASVSFIVFGLWSIRGDELAGEEKRQSRFGPFATVAIAFFIAEFGDKTQLATIALAAKYSVSPVWILMGTTAGMMVADGLGVFLGATICRKIPEKVMKLVSAVVFIAFGLAGAWEVSAEQLNLSLPVTAAVVAALALISGVWAWRLARKAKSRPAC